MLNKRQILKKMALIGLAVFAVSGGVLSVSAYLLQQARTRFEVDLTERRENQVRRYRAYLQEFAKKITKLPVDPNVAGLAQARYFEEYPNAHLYLWAMDTHGQFQFGVPAEAFSRLNRAYDSNRESIEQEGRFADRQDFLRRLIQHNNELDFARDEPRDAESTPNRKAAVLRSWANYGDEGLVFSTPYQGERGEMLGNLYLKVAALDQGPHNYYFLTDRYMPPLTVSGILTVASLVFLWFLLPTWVYLDAKGRGVRTPFRWSVLTFVSLVFGLALYLILRPESGGPDVCPNCGRVSEGGKYCPFCGTPAISEFCQKCGYPVRPEWAYCPSCQSPARKAHSPVIPEGELPAATTESPAK